MKATVRKANQPKEKPKKEAARGVDGLTLGERLYKAMRHRAGVLGIEEYNQIQLWRDANRLAGGTDAAPAFTQQSVSKILVNGSTTSRVAPYLAAACGVSAVWLSSGAGKMLER